MTRLPALFAVGLLLSGVAGCLNKTPMGMLQVHVKDAPGDVAFDSLPISVERVVLTMMDGMRMDEEVENVSFDLAQLKNGMTFTVYDGHMMAGDYKRLDIYLKESHTVLSGNPVTVVAPNGRVYVEKEFTVPENSMSEFVLDIQVEDIGNGQYRFVGNADGSGPGAPPEPMDM